MLATCPYPEPARSSPQPHIPLPEKSSFYYLPSKSGSSKWFLSLRFPHQNPVHTSPLPRKRYMPPPHISFFSILSPDNIGWGVKIIKFLIMQTVILLLKNLRASYLTFDPTGSWTEAFRPVDKPCTQFVQRLLVLLDVCTSVCVYNALLCCVYPSMMYA